MMRKSCFFIGHRDAPSSVLTSLTAAVEQHITNYGVTDFVVGHYGAFDRLAARAVIDAKKRHPKVTLTLLLPYHPADRPSMEKGYNVYNEAKYSVHIIVDTTIYAEAASRLSSGSKRPKSRKHCAAMLSEFLIFVLTPF